MQRIQVQHLRTHLHSGDKLAPSLMPPPQLLHQSQGLPLTLPISYLTVEGKGNISSPSYFKQHWTVHGFQDWAYESRDSLWSLHSRLIVLIRGDSGIYNYLYECTSSSDLRHSCSVIVTQSLVMSVTIRLLFGQIINLLLVIHRIFSHKDES